MLIRPYSISGIALIIITGLLLFSLVNLSRDKTHQLQGKATRWIIRLLGFCLWFFIFVTALNITDNAFINATWPLEAFFAQLVYFFATRFIYALRSEFVEDQEDKYFTRVFVGLQALEIAFTIWRYWTWMQSGEMPARPPLLKLPLLFSALWLLIVLFRTWNTAERETLGLGIGWRVLLTPKSRTGKYLASLLIPVVAMASISFLFSYIPRYEITYILPIILETILFVAVASLVLLYLRLSYIPTTLEFRVLIASLTLFLALTYWLSWAVTIILLKQILPDVQPLEVIGSAFNHQFVVPSSYRIAANRLYDVLRPFVWFEFIGGAIFALLFRTYYRSALQPSLNHILAGIEQIERGNLTHRIPKLWQDEHGRVASAFNDMVGNLEQVTNDLLAHKQELETTIEERTKDLIAESQQRRILEVKQAIREERQRIAEETHDGILQSLHGIGFRLRNGRNISRQGVDIIETEFAELALELQHSSKELRQLIHDLNLDDLEEGFSAAFDNLVQRLKRTYMIEIHTSIEYADKFLTPGQEFELYRIIQEALSNACKHARAQQIWLEIHPDDEAKFLKISVRDDGKGMDLSRIQDRTGWGLSNMERRAQRLGSEVDFRSRVNQGLEIYLRVPLSAEDVFS